MTNVIVILPTEFVLICMKPITTGGGGDKLAF